MIEELDKELVGKYIYGYPTGNNVNRKLLRDGVRQNAACFLVVSVGRKYMKLQQSGFDIVESYNLDGATQRCVNAGCGLNAGYKFFKSTDDIDLWLDNCEKRREIKEFFF